MLRVILDSKMERIITQKKRLWDILEKLNLTAEATDSNLWNIDLWL